jgi:soluble lytic murein transglycosylase-like protein
MRLQEFISEEEWQRLEQLIYASTYKALAAYQQQHAAQIRMASKPAASLKPQTTKTAKALARKAKQAPYAAAPKPLPKPTPLPQTKSPEPQAYRPIKTVKPLPPTTRMAMARVQPATKKPVPKSITDTHAVDQAARRMLPPDRRGPNPVDLFNK